MMKKYKSSYKPQSGFFQSADEIVQGSSQSSKPTPSNGVKKPVQIHSKNPQPIPNQSIKSNPPQPHHHKSQPKSIEHSKNSQVPASNGAPKDSKPNFAFIDGQNLNKSIQNQGWSLDYKEFRKYLDEKYGVKKAYMFIGMVSTNQQLYSALQDFGYHLVFKPTIANKFGEIKGNVDAEMVLYALTQINQYDQAVIVSGDGDFYTLVQYLQSQRKLKKLLIPNEQAYSALYDTLDIDASFVADLRNKLEYTKKKRA